MGKIDLLLGDCLERMRELPDGCVDAIVTDPPYGLSFMGKKWDYDVPSTEIWAECLRVLKPGGHLLAFAGTRTQHRMAVRIEDAGFEIRDMIAWVYGSGFPKSLDVSKAIDKAAGVDREVVGQKIRGDVEKAKISGVTMAAADANKNNKSIFGYGVENLTVPATEAAQQWDGWGTALKPALEPITVARKPLIGTVAANVLAHGTGALNIDGCRVGTEGEKITPNVRDTSSAGDGWTRPWMEDKDKDAARQEKAYAAMQSLGRWPANLIHDGSQLVLDLFPETKSGALNQASVKADNRIYGQHDGYANPKQYGADNGSAARFFYCAKTSKKDRDEGLDGVEEKQMGFSNGAQIHGEGYDKAQSIGLNRVISRKNNHPTVKPTDLMRYLCRLVTPPGGTVLDPFMGSGSTGKAAVKESFGFIGIERDEAYFDIAKRRIDNG